MDCLTKYGNSLRSENVKIKRRNEQIGAKCGKLVDRLSVVIPAGRIEEMCATMTFEEIQQMPYEQMVSSQPRPR